MESPLKTYKKNLLNASKLRQKFNRDFRDFYLTRARNERDDLGNTNEERAILNLGKFIPGKIYTFKYTPLYPDVLAFYDRRPIVFVNQVFRAKGTKNDILSGINLNFLPELARVQTLEYFWRNFKTEIQASEKAAESGKINLAINRILGFFKSWFKVLEIYNGAGGLGYQYAFRNYVISQIKDLRYVEYQHWEMIPFLSTQDFVGASVVQVHSDYWKHQGKFNKKKSLNKNKALNKNK